MPRRTTRSSAVQRLASAYGHLAAVRDMARSGVPCRDVIFQLRAVRSALEQAEQALMEEHVRTCLGQAANIDPTLIDEVLTIWRRNAPYGIQTSKAGRPRQEHATWGDAPPKSRPQPANAR